MIINKIEKENLECFFIILLFDNFLSWLQAKVFFNFFIEIKNDLL